MTNRRSLRGTVLAGTALSGAFSAALAVSAQTVVEGADFGNTVGTAFSLPVGTTRVEGVSSFIDQDLLRMTLAAPGSVTLTLDFISGDANLLLFNGAGNPIAGDDDSGGGLDSRIVQTLGAGDYLIGIGPNNTDGFDAGDARILSNDSGACLAACTPTGVLSYIDNSRPFSVPFAYVLTLSGAAVLVPLGPTTEEELSGLAAAANAAGRLVIVNAAGVSRTQGQNSLATRDAALSFSRVPDPETGAVAVTQSTMDSAAMMGGLYAWVDLTGFRAEDDGRARAYSGRGLQIGADLEVRPDMVAGLSLGVSDLDSTVGTVGQDGVLRFVQPYLAYTAGAWSGEASLIYGWGDYTRTSAGGTGEGETRLAALTFDGGYDIALDRGVTLTPRLGLVHGVERIEGVSGTLAGAGTETVRFTQASLGAELGRSTGTGEVFAGLHADWLNSDADTALVSGLLVDDGWTGRLELGLSTEVGSGMTLDTSVEVSGLGGDLRSTGGALRFAIRF